MISPDNPVWLALSSHQCYFNNGHHSLKYFPEQVSPFVGMEHWDEQDLQVLMNDLPAERNFSVMIAKPVQLPAQLHIVFGCTLYQMEATAAPDVNEHSQLDIRKLGYTELPQMLELTRKTKPGPFFTRTIEMGDYFGIFEDGRLASMAGERLRMPGYTEISAICTDPEFLGRGYASLLTAYVARKIFAAGSKPILHVKTDNLRAIEVYRRVGFDIRTEMLFAIFIK